MKDNLVKMELGVQKYGQTGSNRYLKMIISARSWCSTKMSSEKLRFFWRRVYFQPDIHFGDQKSILTLITGSGVFFDPRGTKRIIIF